MAKVMIQTIRGSAAIQIVLGGLTIYPSVQLSYSV